MRKICCFLVIAISLCVLGAQKMYAQSLARIDGIVADQSQAAVVGAKVTIRNADTGVVTAEVADSTGQYVFPSVLPGTYKLTVQMDGFKAWTRSVVAHANDHITVNVPLSIGDVSTTVTVTSTTEQMDSGQRSQTLTSDQIQALATLSRNAEELVPLTAGVVTNAGGGYGSSQFGSGATSSATTGVDAFNINGNRSDANTFKLDGGNMDDLTGNNGSNIYPNSEFISEITVETSNFTADQGGSPVLITAITKSGTKDLHGEAYYIGRNSIATVSLSGMSLLKQEGAEKSTLQFTSPTDAFLVNADHEILRYRFYPATVKAPLHVECSETERGLDWNSRPDDPSGPNKPEWRSYLGKYVIYQWGVRSLNVTIDLQNGYLCLNDTRLIQEVSPGLFFTSDGEAVDFRDKQATWKNLRLARLAEETQRCQYS